MQENREADGPVRAEWGTFRRARGRMIGMLVAGALIMIPGLAAAAGDRATCTRGTVEEDCPSPPVGPDGEAVQDRFFFLNRRLDGDGALTVRVGPMTGLIRKMPPAGTVGLGPAPVPGTVPWAKAGIMIKKSVQQGSAYAAVMTTAEHGVRMQHDFTGDAAGGTGDRWLRLTRAGSTITGYESPDGRRWTKIATAELAGPSRIGLFAASPGYLAVDRTAGSSASTVSFTQVTASFDQVALQGDHGDWSRDDIGIQREPNGTPHHPGGAVRSGETFTLTGVGDIAPLLNGPRIEDTLSGLIPGLITMMIVAVLSAPAAGRPRRRRVLVANAAVIAGAAAVTGLIAAAVAVFAGAHLVEAKGFPLLPVTPLTRIRVILGTAALCAAVTVLAVAAGALFRRAAVAVAATAAVTVLPYALATALVLPDAAAQWLLRLTPAAGFSILQSIPAYPQVQGDFVPSEGFYPLPSWAGLAVLCCHAALALGLAIRQTSRRRCAAPR